MSSLTDNSVEAYPANWPIPFSKTDGWFQTPMKTGFRMNYLHYEFDLSANDLLK